MNGARLLDYGLVLLSLLLTSGAQILQKLGADRAAAAVEGGPFVRRLLLRREIWWAVLCLAAGTALWLVVLYRMEVSRAFPFLSLGFVLVMLVSRHYLKETVTATRWLGVGLIVGGIFLVARG
jgi:drug/metabolite transporter (DMT)-like permease